MFEKLQTLPADPILGLGQAFKKDPNPDKINLSVGVYQDRQGQTPIFEAIKSAEQRLFESENSKSYIEQAGDPQFLRSIEELLLGSSLLNDTKDCVSTVMTPGGCGALRLAGELIVAAKPKSKVWVSDPTWANHFPLLQSAGLQLEKYAYYDHDSNEIDFEQTIKHIAAIPEGDVLLLHGCCHNPSGADLSKAQWDQVIDLCAKRHIVPFIDTAYLGLGDGVDDDAYGIRTSTERLPEVIVANSCSKNFGLYRERSGCILVKTESPAARDAVHSHLLTIARRIYSMSPSHGPTLVGIVLADEQLRQQWLDELTEMRGRMNRFRLSLTEALNAAQSQMNFDFVARSKGMFCFLGIPTEKVSVLREKYGIYMLGSTRINIAGLTEQNIPIVAERVAEVLSN